MIVTSAQIARAVRAVFPRMQAWRRRIHQYPEPGFGEQRTGALVADVLRAHGWQVRRLAKTGVVGLLTGNDRGRTLAMRADMDALPIVEQTKHGFRSRVPGMMHACGHDANTAMLLGAAVVLAKFRGQINGRIKALFQPCEEISPGGAQRMIAEGVLQQPRVAAIIAGHIDPVTPAGKISLRSGPIMAATDRFSMVIRGQGGHAAMPHRCVDAVVIAAQVVGNLQQLVSRETDPNSPAVLSIGRMAGGTAYNVIASSVELEGTLRTLDPRLRRTLLRRVTVIAQTVCRAHRAQCQVTWDAGHPALVNHDNLTQAVAQAAQRVAGGKSVVWLPNAEMSGEDFTYYAKKIPACFFRVGGGSNQPAHQHPWHHPEFDFDESGMMTGTGVLVQMAFDYLGDDAGEKEAREKSCSASGR